MNSYSRVSEALLKSTSDKEASNFHRYGLIYDLIFDSMSIRKKRKLRICELGVSDYQPGSLEAFGNIDIIDLVVGVDIKPYNAQLSSKSAFHLADAYCVETVNQLNKHYSSFDIVIDDGSHETEHQEFFFRYYQNLLSSGGLLICEDVIDIEFYEEKINKHGCYGLDMSANVQHSRPDERILLKYKE